MAGRPMKSRIYILSAFVATMAVALSWLVLSPTSPLVQKFAPRPVPLSEIWAGLHAHFYLVYVLFRPEKDIWAIVFYILMFVQWLILSLAIGSFFARRHAHNTNRLGLLS